MTSVCSNYVQTVLNQHGRDWFGLTIHFFLNVIFRYVYAQVLTRQEGKDGSPRQRGRESRSVLAVVSTTHSFTKECTHVHCDMCSSEKSAP